MRLPGVLRESCYRKSIPTVRGQVDLLLRSGSIGVPPSMPSTCGSLCSELADIVSVGQDIRHRKRSLAVHQHSPQD